MRSAYVIIGLILLVTASQAIGECTPPEAVVVPDGSAATEEEMTTGQEFIREFMAENERYRNCLDERISALGDEASDEEKASNTQLYNQSVDREQALVERYNQQVRAFNEANP